MISQKTLEVVSKPQIRFKGKARADRESRCSQHTYKYVSIYRRTVLHLIVIKSDANPAYGATQPLGLLSPLNNLSIRREIPFIKRGDGFLKPLLIQLEPGAGLLPDVLDGHLAHSGHIKNRFFRLNSKFI
jgi:hypothetical protein